MSINFKQLSKTMFGDESLAEVLQGIYKQGYNDGTHAADWYVTLDKDTEWQEAHGEGAAVKIHKNNNKNLTKE